MNTAQETWRALARIFKPSSGGSIPFEDFVFFEDLEKKDAILYHQKKFEDGQIIIMWVSKKKNPFLWKGF